LSSIVTDDGTVLLKAASGEDGQRGKAGDGYSGGGGAGEVCSGFYNPGGDGGCNGRFGQKSFYGDPGIGSGFQVDTLPFQVLSISPEACISGGGYYGAGGAGITVEGYGSFGTGGYYVHSKKPGVILLEFS